MINKALKTLATGLLVIALAFGQAATAGDQETAAGPSLYERLGGWDSINQIVRDTIALHVENDEISHYFEGVDLDKLAGHVTAFFAAGTGGPATSVDLDELSGSRAAGQPLPGGRAGRLHRALRHIGQP